MVATVDDEDYERVSKHKWHCKDDGYAVNSGLTVNGRREFIRMHRFIMGAQIGVEIDHVDGNRRHGNCHCACIAAEKAKDASDEYYEWERNKNFTFRNPLPSIHLRIRTIPDHKKVFARIFSIGVGSKRPSLDRVIGGQ